MSCNKKNIQWNFFKILIFAITFVGLSLLAETQITKHNPSSEKPTQEELLTTEITDTWHRNFVKNWNEAMQTKAKMPYFAQNSNQLLQLFKEIAKSTSSPLLAQSNSNIVNFSSRELTSGDEKRTHLLTIRLLSWPKFLLNGNTFEWIEKNSFEKNYTALKKTHHYEVLTKKDLKNKYALAALSYMSAMNAADSKIKNGSKLHLQKPSAAQMADAKKGAMPPPGMSTMMNLGNSTQKLGLEQNQKESFWEKSKTKLKQYWSSWTKNK